MTIGHKYTKIQLLAWYVGADLPALVEVVPQITEDNFVDTGRPITSCDVLDSIAPIKIPANTKDERFQLNAGLSQRAYISFGQQ